MTAHPAAFGVVLCYVVAWLIFSFQTFDWHAVATIATWIMTLFIQRAEHRDTRQSMQSLTNCCGPKGEHGSELTRLDEEEPETIEQHRSEERGADTQA